MDTQVRSLGNGNRGNRSSIYVSTIDKDALDNTLNLDCLSAEFRHRLGILPEEEQELTEVFKASIGLQPLDLERLSSLIYQRSKTIQAHPTSHLASKYFENPAVQSVAYIDKPITSPLFSKQYSIDTQASIYVFAAINRFLNEPDLPLVSPHKADKPYIPVIGRVKMLMDLLCGSQADDDGYDKPRKADKSKKMSIKKIMQKTIGKAYSKKASSPSSPPPSSSSAPFSKNKGKCMTYEHLITELKDQLELVQFIVSHAIILPELRDEILVQLCCQTCHPDQATVRRAMVLHSLCCACFLPSPHISPYYISFLHSTIERASSNVVDRVFQNILNTNDKGFRCHPPNSLELKAEFTHSPIKVRIALVDGRKVTATLISSTTSMDVCKDICQQQQLENVFGFSLFLSIFEKASSLGCGPDHVMDAITECEHLAKERGGLKNETLKGIKNKGMEIEKTYGNDVVDDVAWVMSFRKELFTPWYDPGLDPASSELVYVQIKDGLLTDELRIPQAISPTFLSQLLYIECGAILDSNSIETNLKRLVSQEVMAGGKKLTRDVLEMAKRLGLDKNGVNKIELRCNLLSTANKYFYMNFSALFEAYNYGEFEGLELGNLIIALNSQGVFVLDTRLVYIFAHFKYCDLLCTTCMSTDPYSPLILSFEAVDGYEYRLSTPNADVLSRMIMAFLSGLRRRSSWAIAVKPYVIQDFRQNKRFSTLNSRNQSFELKQGDIIELTDEAEKNNESGEGTETGSVRGTGTGSVRGKRDENEDFLYGICERTGLCGFFPLDVAYIIPVTCRPPQDYWSALQSLETEMTDKAQSLFKKSKLIMADADTIKKVEDSCV